ncbi:MAG: 50S ribosomal protein L2 [Candidatus Woesearchaeota archaeon]
MGKRIISQARGKGGPRYRAPSSRYKGAAKHRSYTEEPVSGMVVDLVKCRGHSAPLALVEYEDQEYSLLLAPEGIRVGEMVSCGNADAQVGNTLQLKEIPEGALVYNIESAPGDGGKFCRAAGTFAKVVARSGNMITIQLPSKKKRDFNGSCRANIGIIAGTGISEKPLVKAGNKYYRMKIKNKLYPRVSGASMNAVDHPFGNSRSSRKARARVTPKSAPPGRKVGMVGAKRTGRKKR